jgi:hypothetical protein
MLGSEQWREFVMSQNLPPYVAILVVDIEKFSGHTDVQRQQLATMLPNVLESAFARCGLTDVWAGRQFPDSTGDGYIVGFDPARLPPVVDDFFDSLQAELAGHARTLRGLGMRLRMRAGLTLGPTRELDALRAHSPVDSAMIDNHRLVDTRAVRALLENSDHEITFLATILSAEVVDRVVVEGGYTRLRPGHFVKLPVEVSAKNFTATAYLRVPEPSGELLARGLLGVQAKRGEEPVPERPEPSPRSEPAPVSMGNVRGVSGVVGSVSGSGNTVTGGDVSLGNDQ